MTKTNLKYCSNEKLVVRYQETRDDSILKELLSRFKPLICSLATEHRISGLEYQDIEQEAQIALVKAINTYQPKMKAYFAPFAQKVCYNHIVNLCRYHQAIHRGSGKQDLSLYFDHDGQEANYLSFFINRNTTNVEDIVEVREKYSDFISSLTQQEKRILGKYLNHGDYNQISKELNISLKKLNDTIYRCRKKLKQSIK